MSIMNGKQHSPPGSTPARSGDEARPQQADVSTDTVYRRLDGGGRERIYPPRGGAGSMHHKPDPNAARGVLTALGIILAALLVIAVIAMAIGGGMR